MALLDGGKWEVLGAPEQAERRLRLVIDTIPALVRTALPDGSVDFLNQRWLEFLGRPVGEFLGWGWTHAIHPDDLARAMELWRAALAAGQPAESELRMRRFDGAYRWLLARDVPLRDGRGHIVKWYGTCTDITDRKHAEERAWQAQRDLQVIFDNIPVMIAFWDASARIQRVNGELERKLGWSLAELQDVNVLTELYPDPAYRRELLEFIKRGGRSWADFRLRTRDGSTIDASWVRVPLPDGSSIGFGLDVTDRKRSEEALAELRLREQERARMLDQLLERVTDGFVAIDKAWRYTYVNRNAETILHRSSEELTGAHVWEQFPEAVGLPFHRALEQSMATQQPAFMEAYFAPWDRWFEDRIYPSETGLSIFFTDITDRKAVEAERDRLLASETGARAEAESALERLRAIQSITDSALVLLGLDELLRELLARLRQALNADVAALALVEDGQKTLFIRAVDGTDMAAVSAIRVPFGRGIAGRIAAEDRPLIVDDLSSIDLTGIEGMPPPGGGPPVKSLAGAPLHTGGQVIGVVTVGSFAPRLFTDEDLTLLLIVADRVAPAVERARLVETARAAHERLGTMSRRLLRAQEEERRRLAGELHDELGQVLTAVKINLESLERMSGAPPVSAHLRDAIGSVDHAMHTVRDLALDLRPSVLDDLGLPAALRWYVDRLARDGQLEAHLSIDAVPRLDAELESACFRLAQEALTNIARHARARHVWLDLHLVAGGLDLRIRDDGAGFDVATARERAVGGTSMGLLGMEERVSLVGGEFRLRSGPGQGTEVHAQFPVGKKARSPG